MKQRFWIYRRRNGIFYLQDSDTNEQQSLHTRDEEHAKRLLHAKNEAAKQPLMNRQMAQVYLSAADPAINQRTWAKVFEEVIATKQGPTQRRWKNAARDQAFKSLLAVVVVETNAEQFLKVLKAGRVSTNAFLRRLHNFALDMGWLPWPILPKKRWPVIRYKDKRAVTLMEHLRIVERERNPERKAYYELLWHVGASQTDLAMLKAEDVDWKDKVISFDRLKTRWRGGRPPIVHFGAEVEKILRSLPSSGFLFPSLSRVQEKDRANEFRQRCEGLGISGITLHSYRYSWAERAKACGFPERFAQEALGHNSKAIHRAYSRKAQVKVPALEDYEKNYQLSNVIPLQISTSNCCLPLSQPVKENCPLEQGKSIGGGVV